MPCPSLGAPLHGLRRGAAAAKARLGGVEQALARVRLGDVAVEAEAEQARPVAGQAVRRHRDDRNGRQVGVGPEVGDDVLARGGVAEVDVEQDERGARGAGERERLVARGGRRDVVVAVEDALGDEERACSLSSTTSTSGRVRAASAARPRRAGTSA